MLVTGGIISYNNNNNNNNNNTRPSFDKHSRRPHDKWYFGRCSIRRASSEQLMYCTVHVYTSISQTGVPQNLRAANIKPHFRHSH